MVVFILLLALNATGDKEGEPQLVLEHSAAEIKLYNNDTINVDVSGWQVKEKGSSRFTYVFPQGTIIPPRGFVVIPVEERQLQIVTEITILSMNNEIVGVSTPRILRDGKLLQEPQGKLQPPLIQKIYHWFNPVIEGENNFADQYAQLKVVGGTANQQVVGPLSIGLGGKYIKKPDKIETYMGLSKFKLELNKFGSIGLHYERLLKGKEIGEHPQKTTLSWNIPTVFGLNLSLNREYRWSDEFKAELNSIGVERHIGNNSVFYTRHSLQNFMSGSRLNEGTVGTRHTVNITDRLNLTTSAELWRNAGINELYYKTFNSSVGYFAGELSRLSVTLGSHLWNHEHNHILQTTTLLPIKFALYLGVKGEINYHIPKPQGENWYCLKRCTGIAYIPTNKFRIVSHINETNTPWEGYRLIQSFKIIMYPIQAMKTSLKYSYAENKKLGSAWVKYLNRYFEVGVGARTLTNNETTNYGLSIESGIREFKKFAFVCGYRVGYNLIGIEDQNLVDSYYQDNSYYVKLTVSENSFEALFEEE